MTTSRFVVKRLFLLTF